MCVHPALATKYFAKMDPFEESYSASTPGSSEEPFADDREYGSDKDYRPSGSESLSSEDPVGSSQTSCMQETAAII
ncbi:unnamed protein product [Parnassius apollo]|uniref:(apollo) hypothetical protein n=1 Tax=Parnassius apollo TaxID=110799 RepID=A0A8S3XQF5_PARAO|nr:unnamed protein product [Parnassius apollo]